ncbi:MAG: N-acetylmuramoyl-L-alanine amidase [Pseudomonas sp.]
MRRRDMLQGLLAGLALGLPLAAAGKTPVVIRSARLWNADGNLRLVLELSGPVHYHTFRLVAPERVIVDLADTRLGTDLNQLNLAGTPVRALRSAAYGGNDTRLVIELSDALKTHSFLLAPQHDKGDRLVLDLSRAPLVLPPPVASAAGSTQSAGARDIIVVVDPGHGGKDPGAVGALGQREKDVVLAIARNLARRIDQQKGFKAKLVRNDDVFIPLRKRVDIAHQHNADMFVSVHADAAPRLTASGASVFALSEHGATSSMAHWLAASENGVDLLGGHNNLPLKGKDPQLAGVILDMSVGSTISSSLDLGHSVLSSLTRVTNLHQKRVEQAGFAVLKSPDIPSILVETGFLSNRQDSQRLLDSRHQQELALSIFDGLHRYFQQRPPVGSYLASIKENARA